MKKINLGNKKYALIDEEALDLVSPYSWRLDGRGYAVTQVQKNKVRKTILMHRMIMAAPSGLQVDHINHNRLDNRRSNLRLCTSSQNHMNRKVIPRGIWWDKERRKWGSQIKKEGKHYFLGRFTSKTEAVGAYRNARESMFGVFA